MPEEVQRDEGAKTLSNLPSGVPANPFSNIRRQISEEDLESSAVQRILLGEVDILKNKVSVLEEKLDSKILQYENLQKAFHQVDKEKDIAEEKLKTSKSQEVLYSFCLAAGSVIIGFAKMVWDMGLGWIFLILGIFLISGGIISKYVKWK